MLSVHVYLISAVNVVIKRDYSQLKPPKPMLLQLKSIQYPLVVKGE